MKIQEMGKFDITLNSWMERFVRIKNMQLMSLPCIIDVLKTNSSSLFYKSGAISQIFICSRDNQNIKKNKVGTKSMEDHNKEYIYNHGICPPFKNVRRRRFRKTWTSKVYLKYKLSMFISLKLKMKSKDYSELTVPPKKSCGRL
ncbi:transcription initiation factor TFIID subunit 7-like [Octopus sinensis]|uniref:Transcription initiation factor TFIID subunit 7-like n=1 Tax=Octopus sinensis TaxID=2607531 RepID=A0A7E6EHE5_9MOLL|nr:transcription initiation factor TFIID subunit 7-like [Octopus sinensis]